MNHLKYEVTAHKNSQLSCDVAQSGALLITADREPRERSEAKPDWRVLSAVFLSCGIFSVFRLPFQHFFVQFLGVFLR